MKKAFDQNVSRSKPRLKLGALTPEPTADTRADDESWVYEVAAQVAGQPASAEEQAPTAREVLAGAERLAAEEQVEDPARTRVEATLRETAQLIEPAVEEERVTVAVGARVRGASANGALPSAPVTRAGPASPSRGAHGRCSSGGPRPGGVRAPGFPIASLGGRGAPSGTAAPRAASGCGGP